MHLVIDERVPRGDPHQPVQAECPSVSSVSPSLKWMNGRFKSVEAVFHGHDEGRYRQSQRVSVPVALIYRFFP